MNSRPTKRRTTGGSQSRRRGNGAPRMTVPWGRAASEYRPGLFIKEYLTQHVEGSCADMYRSLAEEIDRLNEERVEIGEKRFRRPNYSSFSRYLSWFKILGLIEHTGRREPAQLSFLHDKVFYRLTLKGRTEVRAWEDPIAVRHPEFR